MDPYRYRTKRFLWVGSLLILTLTACNLSAPTAAPSPLASTEPPTATFTPLPTSTPTLLPTISPTPDPYFPWTIDYLRSRAYGGGQIEFLDVMAHNLDFTRYLMRYPSDGLNIYGFADIPNDEGPHPWLFRIW